MSITDFVQQLNNIKSNKVLLENLTVKEIKQKIEVPKYREESKPKKRKKGKGSKSVRVVAWYSDDSDG